MSKGVNPDLAALVKKWFEDDEQLRRHFHLYGQFGNFTLMIVTNPDLGFHGFPVVCVRDDNKIIFYRAKGSPDTVELDPAIPNAFSMIRAALKKWHNAYPEDCCSQKLLNDRLAD